MVFVKKWRFFKLTFLCKMDQEKVFFEGSEKKEVFLEQKNIGSRNHQNLHFFKGVSPCFMSKNKVFLIFSFHAKQVKKQCFLKVPKEKKLFKTKKTSAQKTTKNFIFTIGQSMVFVKKWRLLIFSFYALWMKKKGFFKVPKEKKPFQTKKHRLKKSSVFAFF